MITAQPANHLNLFDIAPSGSKSPTDVPATTVVTTYAPMVQAIQAAQFIASRSLAFR